MKPTLTHLSVLIFALSVSAILYSLDHASDECEARGGTLVNSPFWFACVTEKKS